MMIRNGKESSALQVDDANDRSAVVLLLWEVFLAGAINSSSTLEIAGAAGWEWLSEAEPAVKQDFLRFAVDSAAEEGSKWSLQVCSDSTSEGMRNSISGYGLSVLRCALRELWPGQELARATGGLALLQGAVDSTSVQNSLEGNAPNWGRAMGIVIARCVELDVVNASDSPELCKFTLRTRLREAIHSSLVSNRMSAALLDMATVLEELAAQPSEQEGQSQAVKSEVALDQGPVIAECDTAAPGTEDAGAEIMEDIDTSLIEAHERLLRWSQNCARTLTDRNAFAAYTAVIWPAITASTPDLSVSSKTATRMHRFVLELLADVKKDDVSKASPGALLLVVALSKSNLWADSGWITVLQAVADIDKMAAQRFRIGEFADASPESDSETSRSLPVASAFMDDAAEAAVAVLQHVPATHFIHMVPFLAAADHRLQASTAIRLRHREWIPHEREHVIKSGMQVLEQFESTLRERENGSSAPNSLRKDPQCSDVIYAVVAAAIGSELAKEVWDVEEALASFYDWEAESRAAEEEPHEEEQGIIDNIPCGEMQQNADKLPVDCKRRCVAVLSAWELMLLGFQVQQTQQPCSTEQHKGTAENSAPSPPHELVSMALQLTPDKVAGTHTTQGWPSSPAPFLEEGPSPLRPLFRLLFHIVTCERLAGHHGCQELLQRVLASCAANRASEIQTSSSDFSVFSLAARVLFLVLQAMPAATRSFWERLPKKRDRDLVERHVTRVFSPALIQAEAHAASAQLEAQKETYPDVEATVVRRPRQIVLQLSRDELTTELSVQLPDSFPLRMATAEPPEKVPGIPRPRVRNWMLQARQVLAGPHPMGIGRAMHMWAKSFALFFEGVEDCPICYNVVQLTTGTIPRKACPTCKHKFHNECLYHWFKTSSKTTCPLCQQPF
jgi:hypothetical protein